jgi:hypothetical protein
VSANAQLLRLEHVFKIGGVPTYTFVEPQEYNRLRVALRTPDRGVIIEGSSGIGKSTAVARSLGEFENDRSAQLLSARDPGDVEYIEILPTAQNFGTVVINDFQGARSARCSVPRGEYRGRRAIRPTVPTAPHRLISMSPRCWLNAPALRSALSRTGRSGLECGVTMLLFRI